MTTTNVLIVQKNPIFGTKWFNLGMFSDIWGSLITIYFISLKVWQHLLLTLCFIPIPCALTGGLYNMMEKICDFSIQKKPEEYSVVLYFKIHALYIYASQRLVSIHKVRKEQQPKLVKPNDHFPILTCNVALKVNY